jgi:hypothetical protein
VAVIRGFTSAIRHRENDACSNRSSKLNRLFDLFVCGSELLRTCEVGYRSRLTVQSQDQRQVHQFLGLAVQRPSGMSLLEIFGVAIA